MKKLQLAILDLYDGTPNQGMRCIKEIVDQFSGDIEWKVFDTRGKAEIPDLETYDIFIGTGGPGNPHEGDGVWDVAYFDLMQRIWEHNQQTVENKKFLFFICHSFQMAVRHFKLATVNRRKSKSFGTFPVHKTDFGKREWIFETLPNPFWTADFRDWQVVKPDYERLIAMGARIILREKIRPQIPLERAIMGIRFSNEIFGTQFHPEADPDGMLIHFQDAERRKSIEEEYGVEKYAEMINDLEDPDKIPLTHATVLPLFLRNAVAMCNEQLTMSN